LVSMETFTSVYIAAKSLGRISGRIVRTEAVPTYPLIPLPRVL
jgi:hypothetical protein